MRKKRILFIGLGNLYGGAEVYLLRLAALLRGFRKWEALAGRSSHGIGGMAEVLGWNPDKLSRFLSNSITMQH